MHELCIIKCDSSLLVHSIGLSQRLSSLDKLVTLDFYFLITKSQDDSLYTKFFGLFCLVFEARCTFYAVLV